jgi:hypothetical protein
VVEETDELSVHNSTNENPLNKLLVILYVIKKKVDIYTRQENANFLLLFFNFNPFQIAYACLLATDVSTRSGTSSCHTLINRQF